MDITGGRNLFRIRIAGKRDQHGCWSDEKVLSALERDLVTDVRVGCRQGGCGACRVKVIEGEYETAKMSRAHVTDEEREQGYALCCRLFPKSDLVLEPAFRGPRRADERPEPHVIVRRS